MKPAPPGVRAEIRQPRPFRSAAEETAVALLLTADVLRRRIAATLASSDVTLQQYNVLRILRGAHPDPLPTLAVGDRMIESTPGVTRLVDRLVVKKLVARDRGRQDRRCVYCRITPAGMALLARLDAPVLRAIEAAFAVFPDREHRALGGALDRLRAAAHLPTDPESR